MATASSWAVRHHKCDVSEMHTDLNVSSHDGWRICQQRFNGYSFIMGGAPPLLILKS
jgi:hypothetical protein